ncbi:MULTISPECIES: 16S rRNA (guanine(527)-N(7))-methyltransferase RsmG [Methylomonas]|uniref:Ribosomal RNA small subunit methyltransferase G n=2 Tax=Methylomonas TaxID=416 RepID=A0A126T4L1_9GAMM|nr:MULTISPECIES: 16S rRNA (guanine(527)-N(7))-methyltransferase RsmG [Methylomonas]AMK77007.1 16S rRNA (guanine(527)-N(7))-methyltransferase RsmG [Methylomonas denitrificans]OAH98035.1 16S rRNA methyltransferase G [Methylomonas methanica]TCV81187.1 16S rRNA m(7)G-527 methyltransferase [Methylomonas methanica]
MDACRDKLELGLKALGLDVGEHGNDALFRFIKLITKWNKAYNLTAVRDPLEMVSLHILDSLAILPYLHGSRIADIGTGAGLPGIPLAICRPDCQFTLVDSNSKKTRFVQQAVLELKLKNVEVVHSRVELLQPEILFSTVICRAFASMPDILQLTGHLLAEDGVLLAMKGQQPEQELIDLAETYSVIPLTVPGIAAERCLIRLEKPKHG